jgi:FSR family fosmidomycin resistance protein-like MFS transporter
LDRHLLDNADVRLDCHGGAKQRTSLAGAAWLGAVHLVVDAVSVASVLRAAPPKDSLAASALLFVLAYDVLAFAGQAPLGWLIDRFPVRRGSTVTGVVLTGVALLVGPDAGYAVVLLASLGNALFHVGAGATVLAAAGDRAAPAGVFVAPGALGLGIGLLLGRKFVSVPLWPWFSALAAAIAVVALAPTRADAGERPTAPSHLRVSGIIAIAVALCLSVAVRSLVGSVGCDACDKTLFLAVAVPVASFAGKLAGGFLADRFGWIDLATAALLASAPLLAWSGGDLWLALPGLVLFQMTMPVTLTAMVRLMPARPALAFGVLSLALIAGALPTYLPTAWRPSGVAVLGLVLGSALALFVALRALFPRGSARSPSSSTSAAASSNLCRGNP